MARIIVTTGPVAGAPPTRERPVHDRAPVLLDERVDSVHLCEDAAAQQLIERIAWAVNDAEDLERAP